MLVLVLSLLLLTGCVAAPVPPPVPAVLPPPEPEIVFLTPPADRLDCVDPAVDWPSLTPAPAPPVKAILTQPVVFKAPTPQQIITTAEHDAEVYPSARGYWGGSAEQTFSWAPGKVFVLYVSKKAPTLISLPPGELMTVGLLLDPEQYEVKNERVGEGLTAYDALTIRPLIDKGTIQSFILTQGGRRYLFQFVVGSVGMLAVTFETPALYHAPEAEPNPVSWKGGPR